MKIVAARERTRFEARAASRLPASLLCLAATAVLLGACQGSSGRKVDTDFWHGIYGDPDTGQTTCCFRAEGGNNR